LPSLAMSGKRPMFGECLIDLMISLSRYNLE
jgi:hypothetical protein